MFFRLSVRLYGLEIDQRSLIVPENNGLQIIVDKRKEVIV